MLIDTHCHLNFPDYQKDIDEVIKRSIKAGVTKIICVSSSLADSQKAIAISKQYPGTVYAAVGIHPHQTDPENTDSVSAQLDQLAKLVQAKEVVAIGECGLDFSTAPPLEKDRADEEQKYLFTKQIELAQKYHLPLIVHSRKSFDEVISIIRDLSSINQLRGVLHCYTGGRSGVTKINELGFFFGLDGNLTYDQGLQNVTKLLPLEKIILETDSPFLSPVPLRGQRNEPKNVTLINDYLAKIKNINTDEMAKITSQNAQLLFHI